MVALPRKLLRQLFYCSAVGLVTLALLLIANNNHLLPKSIQNILPTFAQPEAIILDLDFKDCYRHSKSCGFGNEWYKIPKDLYLEKSWSSRTFLFTKRTKFEEIVEGQTVVKNIAVYNPKDDTKVAGNEKTKIPLKVIKDLYNNGKLDSKLDPSIEKSKRGLELDRDELKIQYPIPEKQQLKDNGWVRKSHGLWVQYGTYHSGTALTGVDVLFGVDAVDPRPDWELLQDSLTISSIYPVYITFKRGAKKQYTKPTLKVNSDGKFKILQVADLHFSTGEGKCRDPFPESSAEDCKADPRTLTFLNKVLDLEKPDFVVLTGDQIFGESSLDSETSILKALAPFIERKIPFAVTLGNHDDEGSFTREEVMNLSSNLPYSLSELGPEEVSGVGNYVLTVQASSSKHPAISMYFLDTHKYSPNPKVNPGYDWLKESQIKFLENEYDGLKSSINSYTHIHLSMAFFHIPLPEYRNIPQQPIVGSVKEGVTAPKYNTGGRTTLGQIGVKVVSVGHDHCNDYCLMDSETNKYRGNQLNKIWLCYGGAAGEGGYGGYNGTPRRLRVYEINTQSNDIRSWKRVETNPEEVIDSQVLVSGGQVVEN